MQRCKVFNSGKLFYNVDISSGNTYFNRRVVPLLPIAPARAKSDLEASVEKLFDEGGSMKQVDSAAGGGHDAEIEFVTAANNITTGSKLRGDYRTFSEVIIGAMPTMPFVTSSVSATPGHEDGTPLDSVTGANLRSVGPAIRLVISLDSSHHSSTNAPGAKFNSVIRFVVPPLVTIEESNSVDTIKPNVVGPSHPFGKELSPGSREVDSENLHEVFVSHWNVPNDALLDDFDTSKEIINHLAPPVTKLRSLVSAKDRKLKDFDVTVTSLKSQNDSLVHALESTCSCLHDQVFEYEQLKRQIKEFQDTQMSVVNEKVDKLDTDLLEMASHLEERYYPYLLDTISERRWLLAHGMKLFLVKCLNSSDCLTALRASISRAIEKGMQTGIDHGKEGMNLTDVASYNPDAEADFNFALQELPGTYGGMPTAAVTTTALSTNFASASSVPPISKYDYKIVDVDGQEGAGVDGQGDAQGNDTSFFTVEFGKEELDITPARDPPS
uniref:Transposase (Putative), gypsy type n=1 Tax=Tanacetum cinerariifolium TaxID=118510 RepID=A0A6L2LDB6_TANCI|nr:hypothetical protein [Tanacetum cinerariifolium]